MKTLALSFAAGTLTTLSPCVLPLLPIIGGGALAKHRLGPLAMVAGLVVSFATAGGLLYAAGAAFGLSVDVLRPAAFIALGLAGLLLLSARAQAALSSLLSGFAGAVSSQTRSLERFGLLGQFLVGLTLGLVWSPCTGPTIGSVVALTATEGLGAGSVVAMGLFGLGASLPLLFFAYGARAALARRASMLQAGTWLRPAFGGLLLVLSALGLSGLDRRLEVILVERLPETLLRFSTAL